MQTFGVLNIADQPLSYIKTGSLILCYCDRSTSNSGSCMGNTDAELKLMPQAATQNGNDDTMQWQTP